MKTITFQLATVTFMIAILLVGNNFATKAQFKPSTPTKTVVKFNFAPIEHNKYEFSYEKALNSTFSLETDIAYLGGRDDQLPTEGNRIYSEDFKQVFLFISDNYPPSERPEMYISKQRRGVAVEFGPRIYPFSGLYRAEKAQRLAQRTPKKANQKQCIAKRVARLQKPIYNKGIYFKPELLASVYKADHYLINREVDVEYDEIYLLTLGGEGTFTVDETVRRDPTVITSLGGKINIGYQFAILDRINLDLFAGVGKQWLSVSENDTYRYRGGDGMYDDDSFIIPDSEHYIFGPNLISGGLKVGVRF